MRGAGPADDCRVQALDVGAGRRREQEGAEAVDDQGEGGEEQRAGGLDGEAQVLQVAFIGGVTMLDKQLFKHHVSPTRIIAVVF